MSATFKKWRGLIVSLVAATSLVLVGCSVVQPTPTIVDLSQDAVINDLSCSQVTGVRAELENAAKGGPALKEDFKKAWKVDPTDSAVLEKVIKRQEVACAPSETPSPTPTPSASPTTATPSPTPAASTPSGGTTTETEPDTEETDERLPDESDVYVPADDADVNAAEYNALIARCGNKLNESPTADLAKGDKMDFVLKGKGKAVRSLKQYECTVMTTPTVGHMWVAGWEKEKTASGRSFSQVNPWMTKFLKASKPSLAEAWVVKDDTGKLFVSEAYQKEAFKVVTLLRRFDDQGIKTRVAEWHRPLLAEKVEGLPTTIKSNRDYRGKFVVLAYTLKGQECSRVVYLINIDDGRMAKAKYRCGEPRPPVVVPPRSEPPRRTQPPTRPPTTRPPTRPPTTHPPTTARPPKTDNPVDGQPDPEPPPPDEPPDGRD